MNHDGGGVPIEQFIQALTSQLDRAQAALALKARAGMPMTFAVKDLNIDLKAHIDMTGSAVRIHPAGANESGASTIHLSFTTITRPMIEENTLQTTLASDEPSLREVLGDDISEDEQRRLEWAGVHSVSQLKELQRSSNEETIQKFTQLPVQRLRAALQRATRPMVTKVTTTPSINRNAKVAFNPAVTSPPLKGSAAIGKAGLSKAPPLLKIRGNNLMTKMKPQVRIRGQLVPVVRATEHEVVVAPQAHQLSGALALEVEPGKTVETEFDVSNELNENGEISPDAFSLGALE